jgi:hypothetical protein
MTTWMRTQKGGTSAREARGSHQGVTGHWQYLTILGRDPKAA